MSEWRTIDSYPRDGETGVDADWGKNVLLFIPSGMVAPASDYRILAGRLEGGMWLSWTDDGEMCGINKPSHWMPLPEPPTALNHEQR